MALSGFSLDLVGATIVKINSLQLRRALSHLERVTVQGLISHDG
jgi:hypothetical protein